MKLKSTLFSIVFFVVPFIASAQCISKFPYSNNFENFTKFQTTASCDATVVGDSVDGWYQDVNDDGDWRVDSAGTVSIGTGPGSTDTTSGVGVGVDYSPGTTKGIYLYTEASIAANACAGSEINLLSPCFDMSGSTYYKMKFAYHMHGTGMGSLHVDVYDGKKWVNDVWSISGDQGENWNIAEVGLANYQSATTQVRIRSVMGVNFASDCSIDAITIDKYTPTEYDAVIQMANVYTDQGYYFKPTGHFDSLSADLIFQNVGIKSITGVKLVTSVSSGSDTADIGTLAPGELDTLLRYVTHFPYQFDTSVTFEILLNEKDATPTNNKTTLSTGVNDTIYSRDDGEFVGGVGNTGGLIEMGSMYELYRDDTVTSVSFFINGGTAGDSVRVRLYGYTSGAPTSVIANTPYVTITGNNQWYHLNFPCDQHLKKGQYFIAAEQTSTNNLNLGYDTKYYKNGMGLYKVGASWTDFSASNLFVNLLLRLNVGEIKYPNVQISLKDTICDNVEYIVEAKGASTYTWEPFGEVQAKTGAIVKVQAKKSFDLKLVGTDQCGKSTTLSKRITVEKSPDLSVSNDTTICKKETVTLKAQTMANSSYQWTGGPANGDYTVGPNVTTTYLVRADTSNFCTTKKEVVVTVSEPVPVVTNDTTVCQAQSVLLQASGGKSYQWINGPSTANYAVRPDKDTVYVVEVTDGYNCTASDSVRVTTIDGPALQASADTSICFGQRLTMKASGATSYEWENGPTTSSYTTQPIVSKYYRVKGFGSNGCYLLDSVSVFVAKIPKVELRNDTTICEGGNVSLTAETLDDVDYDWSSGDTTKDILASPSETTIYKVVVANSTGCSAEDSMKITVDPLPIIDFKLTQDHKQITISNSSQYGDSHEWIFGDLDTSSEKSVVHKYLKHGDYVVKYTITNMCGSKDTSFTVIVENLGLTDKVYDGVSVYPIPMRNDLNLEVNNELFRGAEVALISSTGQQVYFYNGIETGSIHTINVEHLNPGVYTLRVSTEEDQVIKQVIKL